MAEPAHAPGWYPDPWGRARMRWHDGTDWTGHVDGAPPPSGAPPAHVDPGDIRPARTCGAATGALVTGLLGVPLVPIFLGASARRQISRSGGTLTGTRQATIGIVLGALNLMVLAVIAAVVVPFLLRSVDQARDAIDGMSPAAMLQQGTAFEAQAHVKQLVAEMEVCIASSPLGTNEQCSSEALAARDPQLAQLLAACGSPGGACIELVGSGGYVVRVTDTSSDPTTWSQSGGPEGPRTTCSGPACVSGTW